MTKLKAHIESGHIVLDEPLPASFTDKTVYVVIEETASQPRPSELAQGSSGFVRTIILNESENVWEND